MFSFVSSPNKNHHDMLDIESDLIKLSSINDIPENDSRQLSNNKIVSLDQLLFTEVAVINFHINNIQSNSKSSNSADDIAAAKSDVDQLKHFPNTSIQDKHRFCADLETEINAATTFSFNPTTLVSSTVSSTPAFFANEKATDSQNEKLKSSEYQSDKSNAVKTAIKNVDYWDTVHSIESKQGKLLYRPRNKSRSCTYTTAPCGHHQLTVRALKDIGCKSLQCRKDRLNFDKSLAMSKKLLEKNEKRLKKNGYERLEDYQRYLIHQQGANGIKVILAAKDGKKLLNKRIKKNMANNSPYSYRQYKRMGSRLAAKTFLDHWKHKWVKEQHLVAGIAFESDKTKNKETGTETYQTSAESISLPLFTENDIQLALNYKF